MIWIFYLTNWQGDLDLENVLEINVSLIFFINKPTSAKYKNSKIMWFGLILEFRKYALIFLWLLLPVFFILFHLFLSRIYSVYLWTQKHIYFSFSLFVTSIFLYFNPNILNRKKEAGKCCSILLINHSSLISDLATKKRTDSYNCTVW